MRDETLGFEVVLKRDGFHVFLDTGGDLPLIAPCIDRL